LPVAELKATAPRLRASPNSAREQKAVDHLAIFTLALAAACPSIFGFAELVIYPLSKALNLQEWLKTKSTDKKSGR
jgi:hypothetical protein